MEPGPADGLMETVSGPLGEVIRDIQLPDAISFWPPAPGWWGLLLLLLLVITVGLYLWYRHGRLRRAALVELNELQRRHAGEGDLAALTMGLSTLLRRVVLAKEPRRQVAGLVGSDWLAYLDARGTTTEFSSGQGRVLVSLPYGSDEEVEVEALLSLVQRWIRANT